MIRSDNIDNKFAAKILSGEATPDEMNAHQKWVEADQDNKRAWEEYELLWNLSGKGVWYQKIDREKAWMSVNRMIEEKNRRRIIIPFQYAAAVIVGLLVVTSFLWVLFPRGSDLETDRLVFESSVVEELILPDYSMVSLNQGSRIEYSSNFSDDERRVQLTGEAYFEILQDGQRPFIVETDNFEIVVLGTSFNVRSYPGMKKYSIDVSEGVVELKSLSEVKQPLRLEAGDGADVSVTAGLMTKRPLKVNFLAWKTGEIRFYDTPLLEVFETLQNLYDVELKVEDPSILNEKLGASFSQNTLDYILNVVCLTFNLEMEEDEGVVVVSKAN